jgi:hypothetical protein
MSNNILERIQKLQRDGKSEAEALLLHFLQDVYSHDVVRVELRPVAVSLNSFNGYLYLRDGKSLFFKTHVEADNIINEYYNAELLANVGYPIIVPVFRSTEAGKQILIYQVIDEQSVFDLAWAIEQGTSDTTVDLTKAQNQADQQLFQIYLRTLHMQSAQEAAQSPIHQLFYHRLTGGRLDRFYGIKSGNSEINSFALPGRSVLANHVRHLQWTINGQRYVDTIDDLIGRSIKLLDPATAGPAVTGHGDAHNGNLFYRKDDTSPSLLYFDPAFAGNHHPLLDLAKPLFHNVFAMWMYFPQNIASAIHIQYSVDEDHLSIEHDYVLHSIRAMFLESKLQYVLFPCLLHLKTHGLLREDWRSYLKAALFCCPFLTMNLADSSRFPPAVSLLGLALAVEMGANSFDQRSLIDTKLDEIEQQLGP